MLVTAWAFGTSSEMDAFHLANGVILLFAGTMGSAMDNALLPELERLRKEENGERGGRALAAFVAWCLLLATVLFCAALVVAPGVIIRFFARSFDVERIRMGAIMLWWSIPFAAATMLKPLLDVWALFTERYTLSSLCGTLFNFVAIASLVLLIPAIGAYSVAGSISLGQMVVFLVFLAALGGIPLRFKLSEIPVKSVLRVGRNLSFLLVATASGTLFIIVDRYFASQLPVGSVAAISYANTILGVVSLVATTPLGFFMAKTARAALDDADEARRMIEQTIWIMIGYFLPVTFFMAAAAEPIVSLIYGWGNFDAHSVGRTSVCLAAYCLGFVFSLSTYILLRYAQATQKVGRIVVLSYLLIAVNAFFDFVMIRFWGLMGLALATSVTQVIGFALIYLSMMGGGLLRFLLDIKLPQQLAATALCAVAIAASGRLGIYAQTFFAAITGVVYLLLAEKLGLLSGIPEHWRPLRLAFFLYEGTRSFFTREKGA